MIINAPVCEDLQLSKSIVPLDVFSKMLMLAICVLQQPYVPLYDNIVSRVSVQRRSILLTGTTHNFVIMAHNH